MVFRSWQKASTYLRMSKVRKIPDPVGAKALHQLGVGRPSGDAASNCLLFPASFIKLALVPESGEEGRQCTEHGRADTASEPNLPRTYPRGEQRDRGEYRADDRRRQQGSSRARHVQYQAGGSPLYNQHVLKLHIRLNLEASPPQRLNAAAYRPWLLRIAAVRDVKRLRSVAAGALDRKAVQMALADVTKPSPAEHTPYGLSVAVP